MKLCHSDFFIVRGSGGKTCEPTPHPYSEVRDMGMFLADELASGLKPPGRSEQKWLGRECFRRDNNRCVITGFLDREHSQTDQDNVPTNCAHIIPLSLAEFGEEETIAMVWTAVSRYFPDIMQTRISPADTNVVENAMTMASFLHTSFGRFDFSLDAIVCLSRTSPRIYANAS
jgi:hypothetical protein